MAGDISVVLRADPAQFEQGVQATEAAVDKFVTASETGAANVDDAFADVLRQLVKLGDQSGRTRSDMVRDLQRLGLSAEDAEDAVDAIARETRDLGRDGTRDINRAEDAVDDLGEAADDSSDKVSDITDKASTVGDGLRDLGDIARDVLEGDFGSAASSAVSALGGIAGALTGGIVGGAIASAVSGIVGGWIDSWNNAAKESEERINTWADKFIEAQGRVLDEATILSEVQKIITDDTGRYAEAQSISAASGADLAVVLRGLAGDTEALASVRDRMNSTDTEYYDLMGKMAGRSYEIKAADKARFDELQRGREALQGTTAEMDTAASKYGIYTRAVQAGKDETRRAAEATDRLRDGLLTLPNNIRPRVDVDTGPARRSMDQLVRDINNRRASLGVNVYGIGGRLVE